MSKIPKRTRDKNIDHQKYISRITKTLYYGKFPKPEALSLPVTELAAELFSEAQRGRSLDRLHCDDAANISRNACVSPCSFVIALLYLERLKKTCPWYIERTASSDLFLVSLMVSCKFLYDDGESDEVFVDEWAKSGGTSVKDLVRLEKDFLKAIDWEVFVSERTFWTKLMEIEWTLARKQGALRGFFTYTELQTLSATIELQHLIQNLVALSAILVAAYAAAVLTLFGSVLIVSHFPGAYLQPKRLELDGNCTLPVVTNPIQTDTITDAASLESGLKFKTEINTLRVLKTSIFLASIESFLKPFCNKSATADGTEQTDVQNVSWDWWTVPTMNWLSEISNTDEETSADLEPLNSRQFYETYLNVNSMDLEDQLHKASKVRTQDRLEDSWHEEWTDTIKDGFYYGHTHYVQNIKS